MAARNGAARKRCNRAWVMGSPRIRISMRNRLRASAPGNTRAASPIRSAISSSSGAAMVSRLRPPAWRARSPADGAARWDRCGRTNRPPAQLHHPNAPGNRIRWIRYFLPDRVWRRTGSTGRCCCDGSLRWAYRCSTAGNGSGGGFHPDRFCHYKQSIQSRSADQVVVVVSGLHATGFFVQTLQHGIHQGSQHLHGAFITHGGMTVHVMTVEDREADTDQRNFELLALVQRVTLDELAVGIADHEIRLLGEHQRAHVPQILADVHGAVLAVQRGFQNRFTGFFPALVGVVANDVNRL